MGVGRKLAVAAGAVVLVWGGLWLALPGVIARQVQDKATEALGRTVTVRSVEVSPWSLAVAVRGLEVAGLPGQAPALSIERLYINASATSLLRWAPVLDALELDQPVVRVRQDAPGHWDFADVLEKLQQNPEPKDPEAGLARLALYNIQIRDGRVELDDQVAGVQHKIEALQMQLPFISTLPSQREVKVQPQLSMRLNGSELATQAVATPFDEAHRAQAKLQIQQFDLAPYAPYLPASVPLQLQQGQLDAELLVAFEQVEQPTVQLQGSTLQVSNLQLQDRAGQPLAGWSQLKVELGDTRPLQQQVRVAAVSLQQPFGHVHRRANGEFLPAPTPTPAVAVAPVVAPAVAATDAAQSIAASAEWKLLIDRLDVEGGWASWRDEMGQVEAALRVDQLQLQARDLAWPMGSDAEWTLAAQLQGEDRAARGSLRSTGKGGDRPGPGLGGGGQVRCPGGPGLCPAMGQAAGGRPGLADGRRDLAVWPGPGHGADTGRGVGGAGACGRPGSGVDWLATAQPATGYGPTASPGGARRAGGATGPGATQCPGPLDV